MFKIDTHNLQIKRYQITKANLPKAFNNYKIVLLSDLHRIEFGEKQKDLINIVKNEKPDMITLVGDFIHHIDTNFDNAKNLIDGIKNVAPMYYVNGNHEGCVKDLFSSFEKYLRKSNVNVLLNEKISIVKNNENINIYGLIDPQFKISYEDILQEAKNDKTFKILLSHKPDKIKEFLDFDIVLSGHTHGGQYVFPIIKVLYIPQQRIFPKYVSGIYNEGNTTLIIGNGLGTSFLPFRLNCRPQVLVITLKNGSQN